MNPDTGEYVEIDATLPHRLAALQAAEKLQCHPDDLIMLSGDPAAVAKLSKRVKLGVAEETRRSKRRKQQKASRRRNR